MLRLKNWALVSVLAAFLPAGLWAETLIEAVRSGDTELAAKILKSGKNANELETVGTDEKTPLMISADQMDVKMARLLIKVKGTVNFKTAIEGRTPLMYIAGLPESYGDAPAEIVKDLLAAGAKVDDLDKQNRSAVFYAAETGSSPALLHVLAAKPKLNLRDKQGATPLYLMAEQGNLRQLTLLLEAGADPNFSKKAPKFEQAPLHTAIQNGHTEIVRVLLEHKANPNLKVGGLAGGEFPVHLAAAKTDVEAMRLLAKAGADLNTYDYRGFTPLITACDNGETEMVKLLVSMKADVNKKDEHGYSPLFYASRGSDKAEIIALLKKAGAKK